MYLKGAAVGLIGNGGTVTHSAPGGRGRAGSTPCGRGRAGSALCLLGLESVAQHGAVAILARGGDG